ncbi:Fic family protein [Solihabitans fulvus]|uniref:Fic family protein n=1 Tax=Solihabitans fulvus TaxID=1892852 RepID=A0A5B2XL13_9PSEU|nr:Fic family protein [Solihabitans fulvus]KAA2263805.1 Fic family protein [Solihabitans fulvus]
MSLLVSTLTDVDRRVVDLVLAEQHRLRPRVGVPGRWAGLMRLLKRLAVARAVHGSVAIEGRSASVDDAFAALDDEEPLDATGDDWQALRGHRDALTYVLQLSQEPDAKLSADLVKPLHFLLGRHDLAERPGLWRSDRASADDAYDHLGPGADDVPALVRDVARQTQDPEVPVLVRAAMAHLNLVAIHPFRSGNGPLARCVHTLLLASGDRAVAPEFAAIDEHLGRNAEDYRRVLGEVTGNGWPPERDARHWVRFCLTAHYRQARRLARRAELVSHLWIDAEERVASAGLPERCVQPLTYALTGGWLRNATYRQLVPDLSKNLASRDLNDLVKAELLEPVGEKRGRRYQPSAALSAVAAGHRAEAARLFDVDADPYRVLGA